MQTLEWADSSTPPAKPAPVPVQAFYIGGDTPHVWSKTEIDASTARYGVPIHVCSIPGTDPAAVAAAFVQELHQLGWPKGTVVFLDTESAVMPDVVATANTAVAAAGWRMGEYESKGPMGQNPNTDAGRWVADWTGLPHLYPGSVATQYASAEMAGTDWDESVGDATLQLGQIHPPVVHPIATAVVSVNLPVLGSGDQGAAVKRAQGLLEAFRAGSVGPAGLDGIYGPGTAAAVRLFQRMYGITEGAGTVTGETWSRLLTA
jgi:hypothetical protein